MIQERKRNPKSNDNEEEGIKEYQISKINIQYTVCIIGDVESMGV